MRCSTKSIHERVTVARACHGRIPSSWCFMCVFIFLQYDLVFNKRKQSSSFYETRGPREQGRKERRKGWLATALSCFLAVLALNWLYYMYVLCVGGVVLL